MAKGKKKRPLKPATVNRDLAVLKASFNRAIHNRKLGDHPYNPVTFVEFDPENNRRAAQFTEDHLMAIWPLGRPYQRIAIALMGFCGLRKNEALSATFDMINNDGLLVIPPELDKAKRGKKVPIPSLLMKYIDEHRVTKQTHLVWYNGKPIKNIRNTIRGLLERAGIDEHLYPHDLRRTYRRLARRAGIHENVRRAVMGHSQQAGAVGRYDEPHIEDIIEAGLLIQKGLLEKLLGIPDVI